MEVLRVLELSNLVAVTGTLLVESNEKEVISGKRQADKKQAGEDGMWKRLLQDCPRREQQADVVVYHGWEGWWMSVGFITGHRQVGVHLTET